MPAKAPLDVRVRLAPTQVGRRDRTTPLPSRHPPSNTPKPRERERDLDLTLDLTNMPGETGARPLLPQTAQMQSFTFAPPALAPRENQRSESSSRSSTSSRSRDTPRPSTDRLQTTSSSTSTTGTSA